MSSEPLRAAAPRSCGARLAPVRVGAVRSKVLSGMSHRPVTFALSVAKEHTPRRLRRASLEIALRGSKVLLRGGAVQCPTCGCASARFLRGRCPSCGAASRQRLIALFLRRELGLVEAGAVRLLHLAPEPGLIRMLSAMANVDYVPGDLVPDWGHERVDATAIHLAPDFDGFITSHVLEHVSDDRAAMREMFRVLRPGGWAVVLVPIFEQLEATIEDDDARTPWARHVRYGQHDHVRMYGPDFAGRLRDAGFVVSSRRYAKELDAAEERRYGLNATDIIYFCRKPEAAGLRTTSADVAHAEGPMTAPRR